MARQRFLLCGAISVPACRETSNSQCRYIRFEYHVADNSRATALRSQCFIAGTTSEEKFDTAFIDTIYHCQVRQPNADVVLFSKWFKFNYDLTNDATNGNLVTEVKLAVHSPRTTEVRLAWVALNNIWADSLLAGLPEQNLGLGCNDSISLSHTTISENEIHADEQAMRDACQGQLKRFYLHNECQVSEFICQGVVNSMIRDSGETERSLYQERRYAAIVQPKTFRCGNWYSNSLWQRALPRFTTKAGFWKNYRL